MKWSVRLHISSAFRLDLRYASSICMLPVDVFTQRFARCADWGALKASLPVSIIPSAITSLHLREIYRSSSLVQDSKWLALVRDNPLFFTTPTRVFFARRVCLPDNHRYIKLSVIVIVQQFRWRVSKQCWFFFCKMKI